MPNQQPRTNGQPPDGIPTPPTTIWPPHWVDIDDEQPRYVVHIPINAVTLGAALDFAATLAHVLAFIPHIDQGETTITREGNQQEHHQVICNKKTAHDTRCALVHYHPDPCRPTPHRRTPITPEKPR